MASACKKNPMRKKHMINPIYSLLFILTCFSSCNGQTKTNSSSNKSNELKSSHTGKAKISKTKTSNKYQNVTCGIQDKHGNLWFGTSEEGVYKYDGKLFTQFTKEDGLLSNLIFSLLEDKAGNIWFGTSEGICRSKGNNIIRVPISNYIRPIIKGENYYNDWSTSNTVWSMLQDKHGKIWFGTGDGVYCYDGFNMTRFLANDNVINKDSLQLKMVCDILEDKHGIMWFASGMPPGFEGFCRYDGKMIERYKPKNEGWFRKVIESKNGNLLLATRRYGVWSYDGKTFSDYSQPQDLYKESLNDILEDKAGNLWIASDYGKDMGDTLGGLWYSSISESNSNELSFTKVFNKEVCFMLEDKDNAIWFGTRNMGLYRYDRKTLTPFSE